MGDDHYAAYVANARELKESAEANYNAAQTWAKTAQERKVALDKALEDLDLAEHSLGRAQAVIKTTAAARDAAQEDVQRLEAQVHNLFLELEMLRGDPDPPAPDPPEPEPEPDPPASGTIPTRRVTGNLDRATHRGSASFDFSGYPFQVKPVPEYVIPTEAECDWVIEGSTATGANGSTVTRGPEGHIIRQVYLKHVELGLPLPCKIGVKGDAGRAVFGGLYGASAPHSVVDPTGQNIKCELVGLTEDAEVRVSWTTRDGYVDHLGLYNIGLRGHRDSFAMRCNEGIKTLILDGCYFLRSKGFAGETGVGSIYDSGIHFDQYESAVLANFQPRGEFSDGVVSDLAEAFKEHVPYAKSATGGGLWILFNQMRYSGAGNRTWGQERPGIEETTAFKGDIVIIGNRIEGQGWPHDDGTGGSKGGGQTLTVWQNPFGTTVIADNDILDSRYGCIGVSAQAPYRNALNDAGHPIGPVHYFRNKTTNPRGDRSTVIFSGVEDLHLWGGNEIEGYGLEIDNQWGFEKHGIMTGRVTSHDVGAGPDPQLHTYNPLTHTVIPTTAQALNARHEVALP